MSSKKLNDKLIKVERTVVIYKKKDNASVEEISIDNIPFESLKIIVTAKPDDPLLYDGYVLNENQLEEINKFMANKITPNFKSFFYVIECTGIYDWGK